MYYISFVAIFRGLPACEFPFSQPLWAYEKKNMINTYEQSHQHIISLICLYSYIIYGIWSVCVCTLDVHAEAIIKSPRAWCHNLCKTNQTQQRVETLGMSLQLMIINLHFDGTRNWNMYNAEVYHHIIFKLNMASSWCVCVCVTSLKCRAAHLKCHVSKCQLVFH